MFNLQVYGWCNAEKKSLKAQTRHMLDHLGQDHWGHKLSFTNTPSKGGNNYSIWDMRNNPCISTPLNNVTGNSHSRATLIQIAQHSKSLTSLSNSLKSKHQFMNIGQYNGLAWSFQMNSKLEWLSYIYSGIYLTIYII